MNLKSKKQVVKSLAILFSAASLLTAATPHTFAGNIISGCVRNCLTNKEQNELNRKLISLAHRSTYNKYATIPSILQGANVNGHFTVLIHAIANNNYKMVKALIKYDTNDNK